MRRASLGGRKGSMPLTELLSVVARNAYQPVSAHWNERGAKAGLPPDAVTVMVGRPGQGYHWNLRRGMVPERPIRTQRKVFYDKSMMNMLDRFGWEPAKFPGSQSAVIERSYTRVEPAKLLYLGWREMVMMLLKTRRIRESFEIENLLGTKEYREILNSRRRWEAAMEIEITAD